MIKVYVRYSSDPDGKYLGEFSPNKLHDVVKAFSEFGVYLQEHGRTVSPSNDVVGQFVCDGVGTYFEIVLDDMEA